MNGTTIVAQTKDVVAVILNNNVKVATTSRGAEEITPLGNLAVTWTINNLATTMPKVGSKDAMPKTRPAEVTAGENNPFSIFLPQKMKKKKKKKLQRAQPLNI